MPGTAMCIMAHSFALYYAIILRLVVLTIQQSHTNNPAQNGAIEAARGGDDGPNCKFPSLHWALSYPIWISEALLYQSGREFH